jgi:hypothetical protein
MSVPEAADRLYDLAPAEFVAARNALAKELRAAGDKDAAAVVAKLRRPTATAHAMNQVARRRPEVLEAAVSARAALREATVGGGDVRSATADDKAATRAVVAAARDVLGADDPALAQRVTATLLAAVVDDDVATDLHAGRLASEQTSPGFGFAVDDAEVVPFRPPPARAAKEQEALEDDRVRRRAEAEHRKLVARLEAKAARLAAKAEEAEREALEARHASDAAEAELEAAIEAGPADG